MVFLRLSNTDHNLMKRLLERYYALGDYYIEDLREYFTSMVREVQSENKKPEYEISKDNEEKVLSGIKRVFCTICEQLAEKYPEAYEQGYRLLTMTERPEDNEMESGADGDASSEETEMTGAMNALFWDSLIAIYLYLENSENREASIREFYMENLDKLGIKYNSKTPFLTDHVFNESIGAYLGIRRHRNTGDDKKSKRIIQNCFHLQQHVLMQASSESIFDSKWRDTRKNEFEKCNLFWRYPEFPETMKETYIAEFYPSKKMITDSYNKASTLYKTILDKCNKGRTQTETDNKAKLRKQINEYMLEQYFCFQVFTYISLDDSLIKTWEDLSYETDRLGSRIDIEALKETPFLSATHDEETTKAIEALKGDLSKYYKKLDYLSKISNIPSVQLRYYGASLILQQKLWSSTIIYRPKLPEIRSNFGNTVTGPDEVSIEDIDSRESRENSEEWNSYDDEEGSSDKEYYGSWINHSEPNIPAYMANIYIPLIQEYLLFVLDFFFSGEDYRNNYKKILGVNRSHGKREIYAANKRLCHALENILIHHLEDWRIMDMMPFYDANGEYKNVRDSIRGELFEICYMQCRSVEAIYKSRERLDYENLFSQEYFKTYIWPVIRENLSSG